MTSSEDNFKHFIVDDFHGFCEDCSSPQYGQYNTIRNLLRDIRLNKGHVGFGKGNNRNKPEVILPTQVKGWLFDGHTHSSLQPIAKKVCNELLTHLDSKKGSAEEYLKKLYTTQRVANIGKAVFSELLIKLALLHFLHCLRQGVGDKAPRLNRFLSSPELLAEQLVENDRSSISENFKNKIALLSKKLEKETEDCGELLDEIRQAIAHEFGQENELYEIIGHFAKMSKENFHDAIVWVYANTNLHFFDASESPSSNFVDDVADENTDQEKGELVVPSSLEIQGMSSCDAVDAQKKKKKEKEKQEKKKRLAAADNYVTQNTRELNRLVNILTILVKNNMLSSLGRALNVLVGIRTSAEASIATRIFAGTFRTLSASCEDEEIVCMVLSWLETIDNKINNDKQVNNPKEIRGLLGRIGYQLIFDAYYGGANKSNWWGDMCTNVISGVWEAIACPPKKGKESDRVKIAALEFAWKDSKMIPPRDDMFDLFLGINRCNTKSDRTTNVRDVVNRLYGGLGYYVFGKGKKPQGSVASSIVQQYLKDLKGNNNDNGKPGVDELEEELGCEGQYETPEYPQYEHKPDDSLILIRQLANAVAKEVGCSIEKAENFVTLLYSGTPVNESAESVGIGIFETTLIMNYIRTYSGLDLDSETNEDVSYLFQYQGSDNQGMKSSEWEETVRFLFRQDSGVLQRIENALSSHIDGQVLSKYYKLWFYGHNNKYICQKTNKRDAEGTKYKQELSKAINAILGKEAVVEMALNWMPVLEMETMS